MRKAFILRPMPRRRGKKNSSSDRQGALAGQCRAAGIERRRRDARADRDVYRGFTDLRAAQAGESFANDGLRNFSRIW